MRLPLVNRRTMLAAAGIGAAMPLVASCGATEAQAKSFPVSKTEAEWSPHPDETAVLHPA